ncbi:HpcH/HpaI aldolase/citrate lyase family protein [Uliginosibacterium sp. H1]|uniref:HpcH/HpaI aldolase/citrate lyase family protein n=1 Tax=Uliginosibacterium sp. H1 TaxID=3114757 RepID=UPI002E18736D|nr:aldolase/citrate lyase family protein [Uliginosibacterium sp. H1]
MSSPQGAPLHPDAVLYEEGAGLPRLPAVEHFAGNEKLMRKAMTLQAERGPLFDITFDCEDGAAADAERAHAEMVGSLIAGEDNRHGRIGARIHDLTHPAWRDDLERIVGLCGDRIAYLTLPKPRGLSDVARVLAQLRDTEARLGLQCRIPLHVLIETHGALHEVWQIAALPGVETLDFGLMDFVSAHHGAISASAMKSPGQFTHPLVLRAKTEIAAAALAHGVVPSHNVSTELVDLAAIEDDGRRAREQFGYLRMWSIHPAQIDPLLRAMRPALDDVVDAGEILASAQEAHWGPTRHRDRLHDRASYRYYWHVLKRAHATGMTLDDAVVRRFFA